MNESNNNQGPMWWEDPNATLLKNENPSPQGVQTNAVEQPVSNSENKFGLNPGATQPVVPNSQPVTPQAPNSGVVSNPQPTANVAAQPTNPQPVSGANVGASNVQQPVMPQNPNPTVLNNPQPVSPQGPVAPQVPKSGTVGQSDMPQRNKENLLEVFVGENYDKISKGTFNFSAFFLGTIYVVYRKMYLLFFISVLILGAVNVALPNFSLFTSGIYNLAMGLVFNSLYMNHARKKVDQIVSSGVENPSEVCRKKGGTTLVPVTILVLVDVALFFFAAASTTGTIDLAKKNAAKDSAYGYVKSIEVSIAQYMYLYPDVSFENGTLVIENGDTGKAMYTPSSSTAEPIELEISYSGTKATSGTFIVENGTIVSAKNFRIGGYSFTMKNGKIE